MALARQLLEWRAKLATGAQRVGWKIGRGIVPGEEHLEPVLGHLTSATQLEPGGVYRSAGAKELRVDAELLVAVGTELEPVAYAAALEIVDVGRPPEDFESIVAGNVWHRAFGLGPLRPEAPPDVVQAAVRINGELAGSTEQRVDAREPAHVASGLLAAVGERLEPGDRIIGGSLVHVPVEGGDDVEVDLGELGRVGVRVR